MAKKIVGYVKLEWICPNCGGKNPGPQKVCSQCGGPQPAEVKFQKADEEKILTDADEVQKAKSGPDIHCGYCGARNPAGTKICSQCGGDLSAGKTRDSGQIVAAFKPGDAPDIKCPNCSTVNPASAQTCRKCGASLAKEKPVMQSPSKPGKRKVNPVLLIFFALFGLGLCILLVSLISKGLQKDTLAGRVQTVMWQRTIEVEEFGPVRKENWKSDIPVNARNISCEERYHHTQKEVTEGAVPICGTRYIVDQGSGYAEVVEDCEYAVYLDYCEYLVDDWHTVDTLSTQGYDTNPAWPNPVLENNQRLGPGTEKYRITYDVAGKSYTYSTNNESIFVQSYPGSRWNLTINGFGNVVKVEKE